MSARHYDMYNPDPHRLAISRRTLLGRGASGLGAIALASLLNPSPSRAAETVASQRYGGVIQPLHRAPKAKRVIWLTMAGGPSHLETLDYKPKLAQMSGQPMPESFTKGQPIAQLQGAQLKCFAPQHEFKRFGRDKSVELCALFPKLGSVADEICVIRSMHTEAINHAPAHTFMNTGTTISGRPSMGSWLWYGLGSDASDLPGFVVLSSQGRGGQNQPIASRQWAAGFLPSKFQGVHFRGQGDAVLYLNNPPGVSKSQQRDVIDATGTLNRIHDGSV